MIPTGLIFDNDIESAETRSGFRPFDQPVKEQLGSFQLGFLARSAD